MHRTPKKLTTRQDEETEMPEVCGIPCSTFHVSYFSRDPIDVGLMYLKLGESWHRFFLDAGLLFWEEGLQPDKDDDLMDGEEYVDWGHQLGVIGVSLSSVEMKNSVLKICFNNGAEALLKRLPFDDSTSILSLKSAKSI